MSQPVLSCESKAGRGTGRWGGVRSSEEFEWGDDDGDDDGGGDNEVEEDSGERYESDEIMRMTAILVVLMIKIQAVFDAADTDEADGRNGGYCGFLQSHLFQQLSLKVDIQSFWK